MWYTIALFVHVLGAIWLFCAVSLVVLALVKMRRATTLEQFSEWAGCAEVAGKSLAFSSVVILAPALYMVVVAWGFTTPWVLASLIAVVALAVLGAGVSGRTLERLIGKARESASERVPPEVRRQMEAPGLWLTEGARFMLLIGIVYLMTVKPTLPFVIAALGIALLLGLLLGALLNSMLRRAEARLSGAARQG